MSSDKESNDKLNNRMCPNIKVNKSVLNRSVTPKTFNKQIRMPSK